MVGQRTEGWFGGPECKARKLVPMLSAQGASVKISVERRGQVCSPGQSLWLLVEGRWEGMGMGAHLSVWGLGGQ